MATAKINICTDIETKTEAENILSALGLNMTTAINMYLKQICMQGGIPFEVTTKVPNKETITALEELNEYKRNPGAYKRYSDIRTAINEVLD